MVQEVGLKRQLSCPPITRDFPAASVLAICSDLAVLGITWENWEKKANLNSTSDLLNQNLQGVNFYKVPQKV